VLEPKIPWFRDEHINHVENEVWTDLEGDFDGLLREVLEVLLFF
jgi:hypothetical protein